MVTFPPTWAAVYFPPPWPLCDPGPCWNQTPELRADFRTLLQQYFPGCSGSPLLWGIKPGIFFPILFPLCSWINSKVNTGRFHPLPGGNLNASTWDSFTSPPKPLSRDVSHHFIAPFSLELGSSAIPSHSISAPSRCQSPIESSLGRGWLFVLLKSHFPIRPPSPGIVCWGSLLSPCCVWWGLRVKLIF